MIRKEERIGGRLKDRSKPDYAGRVLMHCDEGLKLSKASMSRFVMFCLTHNVEIVSLHTLNRNLALGVSNVDFCRDPRTKVSAVVRIHPDLFSAFDAKTGGKLRTPPEIKRIEP